MARGKFERSRAKKETEELEFAYRNLAGSNSRKKTPPKNNRTAAIIAISIALIAVIIAIAAGTIFIDNANMNGIILHGVTVAGVDVGGLTQTEAIQVVRAATKDTYSFKPMLVTVLDSKAEIPTKFVGEFDIQGAVKAAYKFGNSGSSSKRQSEQKIAMTSGYAVNLSKYLNLNTKEIRNILNNLGSNYSTTLKQSSYEIIGTAPNQILKIKLGVPEYNLNLDKLYDKVIEAYSNNQFSVDGDCEMVEPNPIDLDAIYTANATAPVNAAFEPETFEIIEGTDGYGFNLELAKEQLNNAKYGDTIQIHFTNIPPEITSEQLSEMLYRDELAAYTISADSIKNRNTNLQKACEAINGKIFLPEDVFSFNELVGNTTSSNGYKLAPIDPDDGKDTIYGGGVSQVASALYYCALVSELEIIERENHKYAMDFFSIGLDAYTKWGDADLRFRNNLEYPIQIEASASGGNVTIKILGTNENDYTVKLKTVVNGKESYSTSYENKDSNNAEGYRDGQYITMPYTGYTVTTYLCKYDAETDQQTTEDYLTQSTYDKRDGVICKIVSSS